MVKKLLQIKWLRRLLAAILSIGLCFAVWLVFFLHLIPMKYYTAADFGIETLYSGVDCDGDGVDDYKDILLGARRDAENWPLYDGSYVEGGYPPDNRGVCTDLVWRALQNAGYSLKDLLDADIAANPNLYPYAKEPDPNIDFRRVGNLKTFFERHAVALTTDLGQIGEWQPGDIVLFGTKHIGVISDKRNRKGVPYLIHNSGQPIREEDSLARCARWWGISGHFRIGPGFAGPVGNA